MPDTSGQVYRLLTHFRPRRVGGAVLGAWMFPVLCWFAATLFLGGNLGKNTDDYSINMRDPVTNALPSKFNVIVGYHYFWRPLHNALLFGVGTLWPDANRSVHVVVAGFHGLACVGLYLLIRQLTRTRLAPAIAALLFMLLPLHGEVAFWFCTTSTAIGAALFFAAALVAIAFARTEKPRVRLLVAIFGLVFLVTCFYEQSAALCAGLPFLCMGVPRPDRPWAMRAWRAIAATLSAGAACALYVGLLVWTAPQRARGGGQSFVTLERTAERLHEVLSGARNVLYGERAAQTVWGSIRLGWEAAATPTGLVLGAALFACAVLWVVWAGACGGRQSDTTSSKSGSVSGASARWLFLAGFGAFMGGWIPIYVIDHQVMEMRNSYVPLLGAAMMLAAAIDAVACAFRDRAAPAVRLALSVGAGGLIAPGIVGLIGQQVFFQRRWQEDLREIAVLRQMVPAPPPNTVFMPLRLEALASHTGNVLFDRARYGVFETPWSAHAAIQFAYRRSDVGSISFSPWAPAPRTPVDKPGADGVRWTRGLDKHMTEQFRKDPAGGLRIPWDNAVPFVTDSDGQLRLVRRVDVERADHRDLEIRPAIVREAMESAITRGSIIATTVFQFAEPKPEESHPELIPLRLWELADGSAANFEKMSIWGTVREATWLASGYRERASMSISLPPLDRSENLLIRATMAEYDVDAKRNPFARVEELVFTMASAPERELASLRLDPSRMRGLKKWMSLVVVLPPRTAVAGDRLRITARLPKVPAVRMDPTDQRPFPSDDHVSILPVWITHGYEQSIVGGP